MTKKKYKLEWTHHNCHFETCNHLYDWRVRNTETLEIVDQGDDKEELLKKYYPDISSVY